MVEPVSFTEPVCSDPDDDKFLEAALAVHAGYHAERCRKATITTQSQVTFAEET
jgi:hypothetical protein